MIDGYESLIINKTNKINRNPTEWVIINVGGRGKGVKKKESKSVREGVERGSGRLERKRERE